MSKPTFLDRFRALLPVSRREMQRRIVAAVEDAQPPRRPLNPGAMSEAEQRRRGRTSGAAMDETYREVIDAVLNDPVAFTSLQVRAWACASLPLRGMRWARVEDGADAVRRSIQKGSMQRGRAEYRLSKRRREGGGTVYVFRSRSPKTAGKLLYKVKGGDVYQAQEVTDNPLLDRFLSRPTTEDTPSMLDRVVSWDLDTAGRVALVGIFDEKIPTDSQGRTDKRAFEALMLQRPTGAWTGQVQRVRPDRWSVYSDDPQTPFQGINLLIEGKPYKVHRDRVVYARNLHPYNPQDGLGPAEVLLETLKEKNALQEFIDQLTRNGGLTGALSTAETLSDPQRKQLYLELMTLLTASPEERWAVLDGGSTLQSFPFSPQAAQATERSDRLERKTMLGMNTPPGMMTIADVTTYNNIDAQMWAFFNVHIGPVREDIAAAYTACMYRWLGYTEGEFFFDVFDDDNKFLGEDNNAQDLARSTEIRNSQADVVAGRLDRATHETNLVVLHGYSVEEAAQLVAHLPAASWRDKSPEITALINGVAAGSTSPDSALAQLIYTYGVPETAAPLLIADHGTDFVSAPAGLAFSAAEGFDAAHAAGLIRGSAHASRDWDATTNKALRVWIQRGPPDIAEDLPNYAGRTGQRLMLCKTIASESRRLERTAMALYNDAAKGYLDRFVNYLHAQVLAMRGNLSVEAIDAVLRDARTRFGADLYDALSGIAVDTLEAAGVIGATVAGAAEFSLQEAQRLTFLQGFRERSELINDTSVIAVRNRMVRGLRDGAGKQELARDIMSSMTQQNPARAALIAQTEAGGAVVAGAYEGYAAVGVERHEWIARMVNTRPSHVDTDGEIIALAEKYTLVGPKGEVVRLQYPRDLNAAIGNGWAVINCYCLDGPVLD